MRSPQQLVAACAILGCQAPVESFVPVVPVEPAPIMEQVRAVLARDEAKWIEFRRDLHRHPELSGAEVRTAQKVADELRRLGFEMRTNVGGHGVVGILRGARPGPLVAYRADMDAVQSNAPDPVEFRSVNPGVRHICGHDVHTTVGLALATAMYQVRDSLAGSVMFVFQPAEERATGARAMLADGVFARDLPVEIYGLHTATHEQGRLSTNANHMMAGIDNFTVVLTGTGDLTAATTIVSQRITALGTIPPGTLGPSQPADYVMVQLNPSQRLANEVRLTGFMSIASSRARVAATIRTGLAADLPPGVNLTATYEEKSIAGVTNDSALAMAAAAAVRSELGDASLTIGTRIPAGFSEDFGSFQERAPGVFFFLGVANASKGWNGLPHHPDYVADEKAIGTGARAMAAVLVERLRVR
jgi:metal-dependent amidase/aminoacylase/carboxypeptidase family protein